MFYIKISKFWFYWLLYLWNDKILNNFRYKIKPTNTGTSCAVIFDEGGWTTSIKRLDTPITNINDYFLVVRNYTPKDNSIRVGFGMKTLPTGTTYNIKDMFIIEGSYNSITLPDNIF